MEEETIIAPEEVIETPVETEVEVAPLEEEVPTSVEEVTE